MSLTIEEIKVNKKKLEKEIYEKIKSFEKESTLNVLNIIMV